MFTISRRARMCTLTVLLLAPRAFGADAAIAKCSSGDLSVSKQGTTTKGAIRQTITVVVDGLSNCLVKAGEHSPKFVLYLDGNPLKGLQVKTPGQGHDHLKFFLDRVSDNKSAWNDLLRNPTLDDRPVSLSVAMDDGPPIKSGVTFELEVVNTGWLAGWTLLFVALFVLFFWAARSSDILREAGPPPLDQNNNPLRKAYSLARCQMAFWFFLIAIAFALIFMITWDVNSVSQGVLALMGISAGTGLAAAIVDKGKSGETDSRKNDLLAQKSSLDADVQNLKKTIYLAPASTDLTILNQQLADKVKLLTENESKIRQADAQLAPPVTAGFLTDLLSDATGISFHRFQMFVWTIILGIVFVVKVQGELAMPEFDATLLGLMGISAGTYIGFKFPEQKNPTPAAPGPKV